ncbi:unnamed protein product [Mycena citricolor]|uniref:Integrase core domain-containing protein n=1 Tax=Mycena citricolor TaxID=2018698 RepID=A0AAD2HME0_9AGAR|nr:unnamed protein product [Mycena citricolor]
MLPVSSYNRNPTGKNQHKLDPIWEQKLHWALRLLHSEKKTSNQVMKERLAIQFDIHTSESTIKRRRNLWELTGGEVTERKLSPQQVEQLVVDELNKDPSDMAGVNTIWHRIAFNAHVILKRDTVDHWMHIHRPEGFLKRDPTAKKISRQPKPMMLGPDERWSGDGHDKVNKYGFGIWMMVDEATLFILGAYLVPNNRLGNVIAWIFLDLVQRYKGVPKQTATDCGSKTTMLYGIVNAIRETMLPELAGRAHNYLRSVHNITVERSWLTMRKDWGHNVAEIFSSAIDERVYDAGDTDQFELAQWLWSNILQRELNDWARLRNGIKVRYQKDKLGPSGMSRIDAYMMPETWKAVKCLQAVNLDVIAQVKAALNAEEQLAFATTEFADRAQYALQMITSLPVTSQNGWAIFDELFVMLFPTRELPSEIANRDNEYY